ncbi:hypothetical protein GGI04_003951 [Coemansia thaxteri]|uniref:Protein kinase domain-containing protein n=1 Tax=Coemansia thaxteri TaxID=2663907 RepID=A0A9W8EDK2_9FUNG|nr:hypothetical protein H4R26_004906 [Coemansia thaxteri]KAJ2000927.1 hypothetical protein GGI04_003951 [Coemansia thaxteri]KAJ2472524.1 hypothetical protein GGI02_001513 [Coemansia sp. RSA 2322]KAJ2476715.1 hypothetical protein EV174_004840 [Coemansia sp. RSA 2320]
MDVSTPKDRAALIQLLVDWSLCDDSQLGRDPTMQYEPDLGCWRIECPDDDASALDGSDSGDDRMKPYYFSSVICQADRLFGRHTRCFPATDVRPTEGVSEASPLMATAVVKDAWAFSVRDASNDDRDEVKSLKRIRATFESSSHDNIIYPRIVVGGRVKLKRGGRAVEDTTEAMYKGVCKRLLDIVAADSLFRAHRRIVTSPIGQPLRKAKSAKELILVVGDVMRCHSAIVAECKILHRDISDNNILIVRREGEPTRGLLIDFDCALDLSKERIGMRGKMTGTPPFMSINNLDESDVKRTSLDDWESLIYLLCLIGTRGVDKGTRRSSKELEKLPIRLWKSGDAKTILYSKCRCLSNSATFMEEIVSNFNSEDKDGDMLKKLAIYLYKTLFQNHYLGFEYHGTTKTTPNLHCLDVIAENIPTMFDPFSFDNPLESLRDTTLVDPFDMRAEKCDYISRQLLAITDMAWRRAKTILSTDQQ